VAVRAPVDMINMSVVWGLSQERGRNSLDREPQRTVLSADLKKRRFRGVIEIVSTGNIASDPVASVEPKRKRGEAETGKTGDVPKRQKKH